MARLIVATVAHIIEEMHLFFLLLFRLLLHVAMAMHFTAAILTFSHKLSEKWPKG